MSELSESAGLGFAGTESIGQAIASIRRLTRYALKHDLWIPAHVIVGPPGIGKTAAIGDMAADLKADRYISLPSACFEPPDFAGAMKNEDDFFRYIPAQWVMDYMEGQLKTLGVILMDDFGNAHNQVKSAALKFIHEKQYSAEYRLDKKTLIILATNRPGDAAGATQFITPLGYGRAAYHHVVPDHKEWLEIALRKNFHPYTRAFVAKNPQELHRFDKSVLVGPCPRAWELVSQEIYATEEANETLDVSYLAGKIGDATSGLFMQFMASKDEMLDVDDILRDPEGVRMPRKMDPYYLTTAALEDVVLKKPDKNWKQVLRFVSRDDTTPGVRDMSLALGLTTVKAVAESPTGKSNFFGAKEYDLFNEKFPEASEMHKLTKAL